MKKTLFILFVFSLLVISGCSQTELPTNGAETPTTGAVTEIKECTNDDFTEVEKDLIGIHWDWKDYEIAYQSEVICERKTCSECEDYLERHAERFYWEWYERKSAEPSQLDFELWAEYNGKEFTTIETTSDILYYDIIVENKDDVNIRCSVDEENSDGIYRQYHSDLFIASGETNSFSFIVRENQAVDGKVIIKHKFICNIQYPNPEYPVGQPTEQYSTITTIFK